MFGLYVRSVVRARVLEGPRPGLLLASRWGYRDRAMGVLVSEREAELAIGCAD